MAKQEHMIPTGLNIVFMGTPDFSVTILDGMIQSGANVISVITAPDRPAGRGRKIKESAIKEYALGKELPILQPTNLKDEHFIKELKKLNADLFVVVAFRMLPEIVWSMPPKGTINLHASLLPQYRGAAPINWAIINGEQETGVTTFFIEKEIDTGMVIMSENIPIEDNMTAGELHDALAELGTSTMNETIRRIDLGNLIPIDQDEMKADILKKAPKIFKVDCEIDWSMNSINVHNFIRGLTPYPGAWCKVLFKNKELTCKLFASSLTENHIEDNEQINCTTDKFLFPCKDHYISISEIQIEGKRRLSFTEFTAGNSINDLRLL